MSVIFKECPDCYGYGVRDSGVNCRTCGGRGRGPGGRGSGELIFDSETFRRVTIKELLKRSEDRKGGGYES